MDTDETIQFEVAGKGFVGNVVKLAVSSDDVLVFQVPRTSNMMSPGYLEDCKRDLSKALPPGVTALVIGSDVSIYSIAGEDAVMLRLQGFKC